VSGKKIFSKSLANKRIPHPQKISTKGKKGWGGILNIRRGKKESSKNDDYLFLAKGGETSTMNREV